MLEFTVKRCAVVILLLVSLSGLVRGWDPDAGIIQSYTKANGVTVTASSNQDTAHKILDSDDNTNWVSSNCLPSQYFKRKDLNILLDLCQTGMCAVSTGQHGELGGATDGNTYTTAHVGHGSLNVTLAQPSVISVLSIDGVFNHGDVSLYAHSVSNQKHLIRTFGNSDSYKVINVMNISFTVVSLEFHAEGEGFGIKDVAALDFNGCVESIKVDLGAIQRVGTVRTRHWAGSSNAHRLDMSVSTDGLTWVFVKSLDPGALRPVVTTFKHVDIRFIRLTYYLVQSNYKHVYCFEIDAWDEHGLWGPKENAKPQTNTVREILGVNGIWGWGHSRYSDSLAPGEGPQLYNKVASHARNYHNLNWDVTDPDLDPQFTNMAAGKGTQAKSWLNWDKEYRAWRVANLSLDTSIQFTNKSFPQSTWNTPEQSAYNYGREFAKHFGPLHGNGLVKSMEVGNEPWEYDARFYASVLKGMAAGARSIDPTLIVIPATFQAEDKHATNTYIGTRVLQDIAANIDVVNCHTYSFVNTEHGVRIGTYPEHRESSFNNIRPITRWRDANVPNKPIWVTEWGWDADGGGEDCGASECVSEKAQAVYGLRGLMILIRSGIERATWFFYANSPDCNTLFCRSGLTTSTNHKFAKKTVFMVFEDLLSHVGDKYFHGVLQENETGYLYLFGNQPLGSHDAHTDISMATHIVGWLPVNISNQTVSTVEIQVPDGMYPDVGWRYKGERHSMYVLLLTKLVFSGNTFRMDLSAEPIVISLKRSDVIVGK